MEILVFSQNGWFSNLRSAPNSSLCSCSELLNLELSVCGLISYSVEMKNDNGGKAKGFSTNGQMPKSYKRNGLRKSRGNRWHVHVQSEHACRTDACALVIFKVRVGFNSLSCCVIYFCVKF